MQCSFCHDNCNDLQRVNAIYLCPDCLAQLLNVSPEEKRYDWFISAMRRAMDA